MVVEQEDTEPLRVLSSNKVKLQKTEDENGALTEEIGKLVKAVELKEKENLAHVEIVSNILNDPTNGPAEVNTTPATVSEEESQNDLSPLDDGQDGLEGLNAGTGADETHEINGRRYLNLNDLLKRRMLK